MVPGQAADDCHAAHLWRLAGKCKKPLGHDYTAILTVQLYFSKDLTKLVRSPVLQERFERQRWRTKNARAARHARVLQRFWHTSSGLVWQDGLVAAMLLASLGLGAFQLALGAPRQAPAASNPKADGENSS